jgi:hypothetical protein
MTVPITTLRTTIASTLANPGVWTTMAYPPPILQVNSVNIIPSDPYIVPSLNSQSTASPMANFTILMVCQYMDNQGNLINIEDMICAVYSKLAASAIVFNINGASAPATLDGASGQMLTSSFSISVLTSWS